MLGLLPRTSGDWGQQVAARCVGSLRLASTRFDSLRLVSACVGFAPPQLAAPPSLCKCLVRLAHPRPPPQHRAPTHIPRKQTSRELWHLDARNNQVRDLTALSSFKAVGYLNLADNKVHYDNLLALSSVHIVELHLAGNSSLQKGYSKQEYRRNVIALIPGVWVLDGEFVSQRER